MNRLLSRLRGVRGGLRSRHAFTLMEVLIYIAIFAMLISIVLFSVNPQKNFGAARDAQRRSDLNTILSAIYQFFVKYERLPNGIPVTPQQICRAPQYTGDFCFNASDLIELTNDELVVKIPVDPSLPETGTGTGYWIFKDSFNRVTVRAPLAEQAGSGGIMMSR